MAEASTSRLHKVIKVAVSTVIGAATGGALLAVGSTVQAVGWHPAFPASGSLVGAIVAIGIACGQVRGTTAAALVGTIIPATIVECGGDDGSILMLPAAGACAGWSIAVLGTALARFATSAKMAAQGTNNARPLR